MNATRFRSMRIWIAFLASLWFVVHCASVVESHLSYTQSVGTEDPQDAPWSDEAENERSDADESEDEERENEVKVLIGCWMATDALRSLGSQLHDPTVVPERAGHGLPPTPPPRRS
jgi:hypothetical protein